VNQTLDLLSALGVAASAHTGGTLDVRSPVDGAILAYVHQASAADARAAVAAAHAAYPRQSAANSCACWANSCAGTRPSWRGW
jgi:acyl-CoA reductase-like NAD-dependent aldehyde dehydrogenase